MNDKFIPDDDNHNEDDVNDDDDDDVNVGFNMCI